MCAGSEVHIRKRCVRVCVRVVPERPLCIERCGRRRLVEGAVRAPSAARSGRDRRAHCIPVLRGARTRRARHHNAEEVRGHVI